MKKRLKVLQAVCALLASAMLAVAVTMLIFPSEPELLCAFGPVRVCVAGIGCAFSLLTVLAFADIWICFMRKRTNADTPGNTVNGVGFGLLPGLAMLCFFLQYTSFGKGCRLPDYLPAIPWITENGILYPCRTEAVLILSAFAAICIWLVLRKTDIPPDGDLLPVSLTLLCTVCILSYGIRKQWTPIAWMPDLRMCIPCAMMLLCLIYWICRSARMKKNTGYILFCTPVFMAGCAVLVTGASGLLRIGRQPADMIVRTVCGLLCMKAVICMGRVTRKA